MKPKPLVVLKNLTLPEIILDPFDGDCLPATCVQAGSCRETTEPKRLADQDIQGAGRAGNQVAKSIKRIGAVYRTSRPDAMALRIGQPRTVLTAAAVFSTTMSASCAVRQSGGAKPMMSPCGMARA